MAPRAGCGTTDDKLVWLNFHALGLCIFVATWCIAIQSWYCMMVGSSAISIGRRQDTSRNRCTLILLRMDSGASADMPVAGTRIVGRSALPPCAGLPHSALARLQPARHMQYRAFINHGCSRPCKPVARCALGCFLLRGMMPFSLRAASGLSDQSRAAVIFDLLRRAAKTAVVLQPSPHPPLLCLHLQRR